MTIVGDLDARQLAAHALGGGRWLLIEPPFTPVVAGLDMIVDALQGRVRGAARAPGALPGVPPRPPAARGAGGCRCARFDHRRLAGRAVRRRVRRFALELVRDELVHNVSSDAHNAAGRPPGTAAAINAAGLAPLSEWLTQAVPAAILDGKQIPPRRASRRATWAGVEEDPEARALEG